MNLAEKITLRDKLKEELAPLKIKRQQLLNILRAVDTIDGDWKGFARMSYLNQAEVESIISIDENKEDKIPDEVFEFWGKVEKEYNSLRKYIMSVRIPIVIN